MGAHRTTYLLVRLIDGIRQDRGLTAVLGVIYLCIGVVAIPTSFYGAIGFQAMGRTPPLFGLFLAAFFLIGPIFILGAVGLFAIAVVARPSREAVVSATCGPLLVALFLGLYFLLN